MPDLFSYGLLNIPTVFKDETIEGVKREQTSLNLDLLNFCHHLLICSKYISQRIYSDKLLT